MIIKSRPTTYANARFRSRLEARWAAFFDLIGWRWEYEPADLDGWVPDFLLIWPSGTIPVEVKPINWTGETPAAIAAHAAREDLAKALGQTCLILGAYPFFFRYDQTCLGLLHEAGEFTPLQVAQDLSPTAFQGRGGADWATVGDHWRRAGTVTQWRGR